MSTHAPIAALEKRGLSYPETSVGVACAGTAIEARTVKVKKKAFLFLREQDVRLKLKDALPEAQSLAAASGGTLEASSNGWIKIDYAKGADVPLDTLYRWVDESWRCMATKTLIKRLDAG